MMVIAQLVLWVRFQALLGNVLVRNVAPVLNRLVVLFANFVQLETFPVVLGNVRNVLVGLLHPMMALKNVSLVDVVRNLMVTKLNAICAVLVLFLLGVVFANLVLLAPFQPMEALVNVWSVVQVCKQILRGPCAYCVQQDLILAGTASVKLVLREQLQHPPVLASVLSVLVVFNQTLKILSVLLVLLEPLRYKEVYVKLVQEMKCLPQALAVACDVVLVPKQMQVKIHVPIVPLAHFLLMRVYVNYVLLVPSLVLLELPLVPSVRQAILQMLKEVQLLVCNVQPEVILLMVFLVNLVQREVYPQHLVLPNVLNVDVALKQLVRNA
mmetsp:Transcript_122477/g.183127  ORF Transcript_122477/g.183127 Transcript_122477/m.183127 type:complete len:325 (-) Transcript_122477:1934-2908(-)